MGLDYIRAQTGKPWRKRWNGSLDRLKLPSLLDLTMTEMSRTVTTDLSPGAGVKISDTLIVQSGPEGMTVSNGLRPIGRITHPTAELTAAISAGGGYAEGIVQRVGFFGDTADIKVR